MSFSSGEEESKKELNPFLELELAAAETPNESFVSSAMSDQQEKKEIFDKLEEGLRQEYEQKYADNGMHDSST